MTFRKIIFWAHLAGGILAGLLILIMCVTGVALTYQKQMTAWADKQIHQVQVPAGARPLTASALIDNFHKAVPGSAPVSLTLSSDPAMPVIITNTANEPVYLNPYTGAVLGSGNHGVRVFFKSMTDWHRWLALSNESRKTGKAVNDAANAIFLFLAVSGLYLWWPRKWTQTVLRTIGWFRRGLPGKARDSNWHNVFGFWCLIPLIVIIVSAVVISYPWASKMVFQLSGSKMAMPSRGGPPMPGRGGMPRAQQAPLQMDGLDEVMAVLKNTAADWKTMSFSMPTVKDKTIAVSIDKSYGGQPQLRSTVTAEMASGKILRTEGFSDMDRGMRARIWMRFVHTGEYYGILGQTIAGIASLAGLILVWTGIALAFRRYAAWLKHTR